MEYQQFVDNLDAATIKKLTTAVEIGRWDNGDKLSQKQVESAMQAVMLWQAKNQVGDVDEPFKVDNKGEFRVGKGKTLSDTPNEFKQIDDPNLIFKG